MESVVGVVGRQIVEGAHAQRLGLLQSQAGILFQNGVHIPGGQLDEVQTRVLSAAEGVHDLLPLLLAHGPGQTGAVVKQLVHVDVLRPLIDGTQKLAADAVIGSGEVLAELLQLLRCQKDGLRGGFPAFGPGEGGHTGQRRQRQHQKQRRRHGPLVLRNTGDAVLQLPLSGGHGGGGQEGIGGGPAHRHQGQQGPAVGDALRLTQPPESALVAGQLTVRPGDQRRCPHQRVEPVDRQAQAPQQGPQRIQMAGVGGLMGDDVPQAVRRRQGGGGQIDGRAEQAKQAGGGQSVLHQIDGISAIFNTVRRSCLMDLPPEPQVGDQKPAGHDGHAAAPDAPEGFHAGDPAGIDRGGLSAVIHHHDSHGGGRHLIAGL